MVFCAFAFVGCGTLELGIELPPATDEKLRSTIAAMETLNSRLAALIQATTPASTSTRTPANPAPNAETEPFPAPDTPSLTPTLTQTPGPPRFSSLYFSTQSDGLPQRYFVQGIQRVYAIWEYQNMDIGVVYRRLWEKDDELWAERYTTWDMPKYGSHGTMKDIFIFDFDFGLQPGKYSLTLDIDGVVQTFVDGETTVERLDFWVVPSDITGPVTSPDRAHTIFIFGGGRLSVGDLEGNLRDLVLTTEISSVAWFSDSRHILYTDRDRTRQQSLEGDIGIAHQLWVLDIITGERNMIGAAEDNFHHPVISPGGRYIAVLSGNTFIEGCQASPLLNFIELDGQLSTVNIYELDDFSGLPVDPNRDTTIYPSNTGRPGYWETETTFSTYLRWSCSDNSASNDGLYLLQIDDFQAERFLNP